MTNEHQHEAVETMDLPHFGAVAEPQNRAAHGGITVEETCSCGASRYVNVNGRHREEGPWRIRSSPEREADGLGQF